MNQAKPGYRQPLCLPRLLQRLVRPRNDNTAIHSVREPQNLANLMHYHDTHEDQLLSSLLFSFFPRTNTLLSGGPRGEEFTIA